MEEGAFRKKKSRAEDQGASLDTYPQKPGHAVQLLQNKLRHIIVGRLEPVPSEVKCSGKLACKRDDGPMEIPGHSSKSKSGGHDQQEYKRSDEIGCFRLRGINDRIFIEFAAATNDPNAHIVIKQERQNSPQNCRSPI